MGERSVRIREVKGSNPSRSIKRRIVLSDTAFLFVLGSCFFQYSCPSGCDTSKLLPDNLKNKLYYDCFQKVLSHYSHQTRKLQTFSRKRRVRIFCFWRRAPPHNKSIRSAWPGCFSSGAVRCGCLFFMPRPLS